MHTKNIVHRDIKPLNLMMLDNNQFNLCDYGEGINLDH